MSDDRLRTGAGRILLDLLHVISPGAHYSDSIRAIEDEAWMRAEEARATDTAPGPWNRPADSPELRDCTLCRIGTPIDPHSPLWPEDHVHRIAREYGTPAAPDSLDAETLARAIQSTILTSPDEYMGPGMGAYRERWDRLTDKQKRHVLRDAAALIAEYHRLRQQQEPATDHEEAR